MSARNHSIFKEENSLFFHTVGIRNLIVPNISKNQVPHLMCIRIIGFMKSGDEMFGCFFQWTKKRLSTLFKYVYIWIFLIYCCCYDLEQCFSACAHGEFEINGECCPMCAPGNRVYWHCTIDTSTLCVPCPALMYTDEPNGLDTCFACTPCDAANGLRVKKTCTRSSDTVCEPLAGFYCIQRNKDGCKFALEHSRCQPGQYIKQAGTAFTNTECGNCPEGSYSNGLFTTCHPHLNCEKEGRKEKIPGTVSSDVECEDSAPVAVIVGAAVGVGFLLIVGIAIYFILKHKKPQNSKRAKCQVPKQKSASKPTSPGSVNLLIPSSLYTTGSTL